MNNYRPINKSTYPPGPWHDEPDRVLWTEPQTGLVCYIHRHAQLGTLNAYVQLPHNHPWEGQRPDVPIHGGITYSSRFTKHPRSHWWLGFDCGHGFDHSPIHPYPWTDLSDYRTFAYVRRHVLRLAKEIGAAA